MTNTTTIKARTIKYTTKGGTGLKAVEFIATLGGERRTGMYHVFNGETQLKTKDGRMFTLSKSGSQVHVSPLGVRYASFKLAFEVVAHHAGIA